MPENAVDVLIVRGAPGVGKSTAVRRLRKLIPKGAVVEVDTLRGMIAAVEWVNTEQHEVALDHARLLITGFLTKGYRPVVVVDTFSRGKLTGFVKQLDMPYRIASLYAEEEELERRVTERPEGGFKDLDACRILNAEVATNRYPHEELIDVTHIRPTPVAQSLEQLLCRQ